MHLQHKRITTISTNFFNTYSLISLLRCLTIDVFLTAIPFSVHRLKETIISILFLDVNKKTENKIQYEIKHYLGKELNEIKIPIQSKTGIIRILFGLNY